MTKKILFGVCTAALAIVVACSKTGAPVSPEPVDATSGQAAPDGSTLKIGKPGIVSPGGGFQFARGASIRMVITNVQGTFITFPVLYEIEIKNQAGTVVDNPKFNPQPGATTEFVQTAPLPADSLFSWRARARHDNAVGPWSNTETFRTAIQTGISTDAQGRTIIIDPLLDGRTFGEQKGGQMIFGQGWQAKTVNDGLDYDIKTCDNCTVEFDVTNFGKKEGECCNADMKWFSMADAPSFADFGSFRNSPWKMHVVQRADWDSGFEIIWRNGDAGDGDNPGDHRQKLNETVLDYRATSVFHFVISWNPSGFEISVGTNGGAPIEIVADDSFDGFPYRPPQHRLSLGCYPRGETIVGTIYRNFTLFPNK